MKKETFSFDLGKDKFEVILSPIAEQAHGHVLVRYGDTMVLATAVMNKRPREGGDYFPLMVDYEEKFYAAGKILSVVLLKEKLDPRKRPYLWPDSLTAQ